MMLHECCVLLLNISSFTVFSVWSLPSFSVVTVFHTSCVGLFQLYNSDIFLNNKIFKITVFSKSPLTLFTFLCNTTEFLYIYLFAASCVFSNVSNNGHILCYWLESTVNSLTGFSAFKFVIDWLSSLFWGCHVTKFVLFQSYVNTTKEAL